MKVLVSSRFYSVFLCVWMLGMLFIPGIHIFYRPWYYGYITKYYGQGEGYGAEHGNDISCFGVGTPISALLSGTVTFAGYTSFGFYEVTWKLDHPQYARGSPYMYVEDMSWIVVRKGMHIRQGQVVGYSLLWVEFGLTPDYAYGISNWRWGVNSYFLIIEARNGTLPLDIPHTKDRPLRHAPLCLRCSFAPILPLSA